MILFTEAHILVTLGANSIFWGLMSRFLSNSQSKVLTCLGLWSGYGVRGTNGISSVSELPVTSVVISAVIRTH